MYHISPQSLIAFRQKFKISQGRLALETGLTSFKIGRFEQGKDNLTESQLSNLKQFINFSSGLVPEMKYTMNRQPDQLILKNTPNSPHNKRICWNDHPCYRELECDYCWNRKQPFLIDQFLFYGHHWGLCSFVTISFLNTRFKPDSAIQFLSLIRSEIHKKLFRKQKYVSLIAIHGDLKTPHFHIATTEKINKTKLKTILKKALLKFDENIRCVVNVKAITDLYGLGRYFVVENLRPTLAHRPKGVRLMSASRPFLTGKPKKIKHIQDWKKQWKEKPLYKQTIQINKITELAL